MIKKIKIEPKGKPCLTCGTILELKNNFNGKFWECPNKKNHYKFHQQSKAS